MLIADASCTRIICNEELEHVEDNSAFLTELVRIGAPGARYLFCVPGALGEEVLKHIAHPSYFSPPSHIRIIESADFQRMIADSGLTVESLSTYGAFRTLWWCDRRADFTPRHPVIDHVARAWNALLDSENGLMIKRSLDQAIPKSQAIVAYKP